MSELGDNIAEKLRKQEADFLEEQQHGGIATSGFEIKDSGERQEFESGMVRDTAAGKIDYTLIMDGPMHDRYAIHLTNAALRKYGARNWMKARTPEEQERYRVSGARHMRQWVAGERDEDHASAVMFNLNGYEYVQLRLDDPVFDALMTELHG